MPTGVNQRNYEKKHRAAGLCRTCPDKATHGIFCRKHWLKSYRARRKRMGAKRKNKIRVTAAAGTR